MTKFCGLKIGQRVMCNGYEGSVSRLCEWSSGEGMVEVRLDSGVVCVAASTVTPIS